MNITLENILEKEIFDSYSILSGHQSLHNKIESVSILETPDFDNYIIENSLILTTYYPLRDDLSKSLNLIKTLQKKNTAGLIVKVNRYIDEIPEDVLELAIEISFPIITLDYDANLSVLFNNILSEIQAGDYSTYSIDKSYSRLLKKVYDAPTTNALIDEVNKIEGFELLIQNTNTKNMHYSSNEVLFHFNKMKQAKNIIKRIGSMIYYSEVIIYEEKPIYQMVFLIKDDRRHMLHNYLEIFKLLIIVIYQKKMENTLKQNEFLLNFVSNLSSSYTNKDIQKLSKQYNWEVRFPVVLVMLSIKEENKNFISPSLLNYIQTLIVSKFHVYDQEIKYAYLNEKLLFIINASATFDNYEIIKHIYNQLSTKYPNLNIKIVFSNLINEVKKISNLYRLLSESIIHIERNNINTAIYTESNIELLHLLKNIDYSSLRQFTNKILNPLIEYESKNDISLIDTLYIYFKCKFNAKECAKELYIHYNSLRHRLSIIKDLGYDLSNDSDHFDLYFAIHLYKNFQP